MRRVVVIGKSGQLARALAERAEAEQLELSAFGRHEFDLTQTERIASFMHGRRPDGVINASANNEVDAAERDPDAAFALNRDGPTVLAQVCAEMGVPLVHVSTDYVFGDTPDGAAHLETEPPSPMNAYGRSKAEGERGVLAAGGAAAVVRTCWVYSGGGKYFVTLMLGLARDGRSQVRVVEDQIGQPTYAPDLAGACVTILRALAAGDERARGHLHYRGADAVNRAEFAEAIFKGARERGLPSAEVVRITAATFGAAAPRPSTSLMDMSRALSLPGIDAYGWRERLPLCLDRLAAPKNT